MNKIEQAKFLIIEAMDAIRSMLQDESELSKEQLFRFQKSLSIMLQEINSGEIPLKQYRVNYLGHSIIDSWPIHDKKYALLGEKIIKAEKAYLGL